MISSGMSFPRRLAILLPLLTLFLAGAILLGLATGFQGIALGETIDVLLGNQPDSMFSTIVWQIRFPRVVLAVVVGATLSLGGLVFQALLRNPLAEPYILGVSGGSAVGAILGMFAGFAQFPGVALSSFGGSMLVLGLVVLLAGNRTGVGKDSLLLGGVMMNAFCGAVIMFLISISQSSQTHHILFWLMGDFSMFEKDRFPVLIVLIPCFLAIIALGRPMNLLLLGRETAAGMGVNVQMITLTLLLVTSFMVSLVVCQSGLVGFVGLVVPHIFRLLLGPDHRLLAPACILGGGGYLALCDLLARTLPATGEMPVGIITAMIGAPLFIFLLWRSRS